MKLIFRISIIVTVALISSLVAMAQPAPSPIKEQANSLFQSGKWEDAAKLYEEITKSEPRNGQSWFRLGYCMYSLGKYESALTDFQKVVEISKNPQAMYNVGAMHAKLNHKDEAFEWLNKSLDNGIPAGLARAIPTDNDLESLHNDVRYKTLLVAADKLAKPCMNQQRFRDFDFWVGEWDVFGPGKQQVGTNSVQLLEDGCIIMENWHAAQGGQTGKSLNYFDPTDNKWHQVYVGNDLLMLNVTGEYKDDALRFEGEKPAPNGGRMLVHMTFFKQGSNQVRQLIENSFDGGKTWVTGFDGTYVRKK